MRDFVRNPVIAYAAATCALAAAVLIRWLLDPWLGDDLALVTLFGAVAIAVWLAGDRMALLVAILGYLACDYLFIEPRDRLGIDTIGNLVGLIAYLFTCLLIIAIGDAMRSARARASERGKLLSVTLEGIGDAVITTDGESRVTYLNGVAESLSGCPSREALGRPLDTVFRIVDELSHRPLENPAMLALRNGPSRPLNSPTTLIAQGGVERPVEYRVAPIHDERGNVSGCVLIFRDISERRRWEKDEANRLSSARMLASIVESSDDAIISKSLDGIIQSWNAAAERLFGYTAENAVGRHISLVIPRERIAEEDQIIARLKAGQRVEHFATERVRSDGERILVSLTISPIKDEAGKVVGASKIVRDITRQREGEVRERRLLAEAAASNAKFRAFFDQGALFAGIMDIDGTLLEPNRLSLEGCGYTREQCVGKRFWEGPWWAPSSDLAARIEAACAAAAAGNTFHAEMPYFVADGSERMVELAILPIKDDTGRILFLAPTGTDITDRRRAEAERRRLEDNLRALAADLSLADRRKDEFLATLSHELRNPLAPLLSMLELLKRGAGDARTLETMDRQLGQLVRLVDDLLDLNRITHNRIELRRSPVDLGAVIEQAVQASQRLTGAEGHETKVIVPRNPIYVHADPVRLMQIFGNLLNNGYKYTGSGGSITIRAERDGDEAVVSVADTGIGIPHDQLDRIFDMFTQVDRSLERSKGGLGIGLSLVKRLVEMHGGTVEARSAGEGRGSEFVVRLPILADHVASSDGRTAGRGGDSARPPHPGRRRQPGRRVLARDTARGHRQRDFRRPRRRRGAGCSRPAPSRSRAARHRPAEGERIRCLPPHPPALHGRGDHRHRADRVGTGGGSAEVARRGIRRASRQAGRSRDTHRAPRPAGGGQTQRVRRAGKIEDPLTATRGGRMDSPKLPYHAHIYYEPATRATALAFHRRLGELMASREIGELVYIGQLRDHKVGPHPIPQFEVHFTGGALPAIVPLIEASGLTALVHPLTEDDLGDHTRLARWIGQPIALDLTTLDPPGVNQGIARFSKSDF